MNENRKRAEKIKRLLGLNGFDNEAEYYAVKDVLCDLQHYCDHFDGDQDGELIDFNNELELSRRCYESERILEE
tara:strand:+ start:547 stop:768 length:222 start_codon:yes stop_codon:yes gene_type:complete